MITTLVLVVIVVAAGYSMYLHKRRVDEFHNWLSSLLSTLVSVIAGVVTAVFLIGYQDTRESMSRKLQLQSLVALELSNDLAYLQNQPKTITVGTNSWSFRTSFLEHQAIDAASLSGLFTEAQSRDLLVLGTNIRFYNDMIRSVDSIFSIPVQASQIAVAQNLFGNQDHAFRMMEPNIRGCFQSLSIQRQSKGTK